MYFMYPYKPCFAICDNHSNLQKSKISVSDSAVSESNINELAWNTAPTELHVRHMFLFFLSSEFFKPICSALPQTSAVAIG